MKLNTEWQRDKITGFWFCRLSAHWLVEVTKETKGMWRFRFFKDNDLFFAGIDGWPYMQSARAEANRIIAKANEMTANKRKEAVGV